MIEFFDVRQQYLDNQLAINPAVQLALATGNYFSGPNHSDLSNIISQLYNQAAVTLTNSGTSALITALIALDLKKGSRVLMPTLTYAATAQAVVAAGCQPTFVDIDEHYLLDLENLIHIYQQHSDISAVIAVDLYGQGCNLAALLEFCRKEKIPLIIDAAQSFGICGSAYDQTQADAVCLSFNPLKNWGGIGGGAVVTKKINAAKLHAITHCGKDDAGKLCYAGGNYRMDAVQAAVLLSKIKYSQQVINHKSVIDLVYRTAFSDIMPKLAPWSQNHNVYVSVIAPSNPEQVRNALTAANIEFRSHYDRPLHLEPVFQGQSASLPRAESLAGRLISLPNHRHTTMQQVSQVIETVRSSL